MNEIAVKKGESLFVYVGVPCYLCKTDQGGGSPSGGGEEGVCVWLLAIDK